MNEPLPLMRKDLQFIPLQHEGQQLVLIRDQLGLVEEGKAISPALYQVMVLLDGTRTMRDLQMVLMRQKGGVLVGTDEVKALLDHLDDSCLLDSERFRVARDRIVAEFASKKVRPCSHCGQSYPKDVSELEGRLNEILASQPPIPKPGGKIRALVAPHIDFAAGHRVYSRAYQTLSYTAPSRVVVLGVRHSLAGELFSLTDKDFETPMGVIRNEQTLINELREVGGDIISESDFPHRSEHSIEFQAIFLQHLLKGKDFTIIPILCGSIQSCFPDCSRDVYLEKATPFLNKLRETLMEAEGETLLVAGVDFSHIGPKFGHERPAQYLEGQSEAHDKNLMEYLCKLDADRFWEESRNVNDQFNVCGFSALACMLEILPPCKGEVLGYQLWHEEATRSAVSFAAILFTS